MVIAVTTGMVQTITPCALQDEKLGRLLSSSLSQNYDAVIGSLPKGLTTDERMRIKSSMPMSPAMGALQKIPEVSAGSLVLPATSPGQVVLRLCRV